MDRLVELQDGQEPGPDLALKDLNFNRKLSTSKSIKKTMVQQLEKDSKWLEDRNICDYSLLVGIAFLSPLSGTILWDSHFVTVKKKC